MIKIIARVMGGNFDSKINGQIETSVPTITCTSLRLDSGFQRKNDLVASLMPNKRNIVTRNRRKVIHSLIKGFQIGNCIG